MKKNNRVVMIVLILILAVSLSGCFGSFSLTKKVYKFNKGVGAEPMQTLAMWVMHIVPVYGFSIFADVVVFNTLEYWTGSNPIAMHKGDQEIKYFTENGIDYKLVITQNKLDFYDVNNAANHVAYVFNPENETWSMNKDGQSIVVADINSDQILLYGLDGKLAKTIKR